MKTLLPVFLTAGQSGCFKNHLTTGGFSRIISIRERGNRVKIRDIIIVFVLFVGVIAMLWYGVSQFFDESTTDTKKKNSNVSREDIKSFQEAIRDSDYQTIEKLLQKGVDPNSKGEYDSDIVKDAVRDGDIDLVTLLAKYKADLNKKDKSGKTPLYIAINAEDIAMVERLLTLGAKATITDDKGETVLWKAVETGNVAIVETLLKHGVDIKQTNFTGENVMFQRIDANAVEMVRYLKGKGLALDSSNHKKERAAFDHMHYSDHFNALLANGLNPNLVEEKYGNSLLDEAVESNNYAATQALLKAGANVNSKDGYGSLILSKAIKRSNFSIVQSLIAHGADINAVDDNGYTACMEAVAKQKKSVVEALLATNKVNLEQKNNKGKTALQLATEIGNKDIIALLSAAATKKAS